MQINIHFHCSLLILTFLSWTPFDFVYSGVTYFHFSLLFSCPFDGPIAILL
jgi:hypothetical protein